MSQVLKARPTAWLASVMGATTPAPQPTSPFFDVAVSGAQQFARALEHQTHWIDADAPVHRGRAQASCGSVVDVRKFSRTPTCPACRQQEAIADTYRF